MDKDFDRHWYRTGQRVAIRPRRRQKGVGTILAPAVYVGALWYRVAWDNGEESDELQSELVTEAVLSRYCRRFPH